MNTKIQSRDETNICKHISRLLGNDHRSALIIEEVQRWRRSSGSQWTLDRLKSLKQNVLLFLSDETYMINKQFPELRENWFKKDGRGWPKGHLGKFMKKLLLTGNNRDHGLLLSVLSVGSAFIAPKVTETQKKKFLEAICGEPIRPDLNEYSHRLGSEASSILMFRDEVPVDKLKDRYWLMNKIILPIKFKKLGEKVSSKDFSLAGLNSSKPSTTFQTKQMKNLHPWVYSLIEGTILRGPWTRVLNDMEVPTVDKGPAVFGGRISVIQEGGLKARVIGVPTAAAQVAFKPLHMAIDKILRLIPEDCTHDQMSGSLWAGEKLSQGRTVYAVDLSSATDNFPLGFQQAVLEKLGYEYTNEFVETCRMKFGTTAHGKPLQYTKGQPMGLYGSFVLFALSHHVLLKKIESDLGVVDTYRILGDDIVISDRQVNDNYRKALKALGIPVSEHKCLTSDLLTEFAGKVVRPNGLVHFCKPPKNNVGLINLDQFFNYCRVTQNSKDTIRGVPKNFRKFAKSVISLPEIFGGLGLNPEGLSIEERLTNFEQSKHKSYPLKRDLWSSLTEASLLSTHDHVNSVCSYVSDQLTKLELKIETELNSKGFQGMSRSLSRALLSQILDSSMLDDRITNAGTLSNNTSNNSIFKNWKASASSMQRKVEKRFDAVDLESISRSIDPSWEDTTNESGFDLF